MSALGSPSPLFLASAAAEAAAGPIKSVRFNNDDSAYLNRSATDSGSNVYKYTVSWWMKIGSIGTDKTIVSFATNNTVNGWTKIHLRTDHRLSLFGDSSGTALSIRPTMLFRDPSAWYHCVVSLDTTQSSYSSQAKFYINGVEQTLFTGTQAFAQNTALSIGEATTHHVGVEPNSVGELRNYFDGYIADLHVIEGQIKQATDFGAFDDNGVWQAANYTGTYGNNGYHLFDFANETGIGDDSSGNDNDFTTNNLSASIPSIASFSSPSWSNPGSFWTLSDQDSNSNYQSATYGGSSQYSNVTSSVLANNTTYHFFLEQYAGQTDSYSGWFFVDGSSAPSNTVPDELGGNTLGLRVGETSAGTYGSYATANGTSQTQNQINLSSISANTNAGDPTFVEFVINTTVDKVWVRLAGASSWIGGGDPATSSSTPSFHLSGASNMRFGYVAYGSGTYAKYKSVAGSPSDIDLLFDVPTNGDSSSDTGAGGEVSGNYAVLNPAILGTYASNFTLSEGNLKASFTNYATTPSTIAVSSGKWYCEGTLTALGSYSNQVWAGLLRTSATKTDYEYFQGNAPEKGVHYWGDNQGLNRTQSYGVSYATAGTCIGIAFDADAGSCTWYVNGSSQGASTYNIVQGEEYFFSFGGTPNAVWDVNFGARSFKYSAPSGYKTLCTTNLPDPTVADGSDYFDVTTYSGTQVTRSITGLGFGPDLVWTKSRSNSNNHEMYDSVRGAQKLLYPNRNDTEVTTTNGISSFNSEGWTMGNRAALNYSGRTYVAWAWDAGTSTASNTDGTITSQVRANQTAGFSIVTYTGNGTNGATVGHGLNAAPDFVITKNRTTGNYWAVYPSVLDGEHLRLNLTMGSEDEGNYWSSFSNSVMTLPGSGSTLNNVNNSSKDYVSYCWSSVKGFSKFGEFMGNGNSDGPFVYLGFKPALIIIKGHDFTSNWFIHDYKRPGYNQNTGPLRIAAEVELTVTTYDMDFLSNGFKMRTSSGDSNQNNKNFAYFAWAENPFQANGGLAR